MLDTDWMTGPQTMVDPDRVRAFADAVGHPRATVPPTFAVTVTWAVQNRVMDRTLPSSGLGLHGEQAMRFVRHLEVGEPVVPRARLESVVPHGSGTTVTCRTEILASGRPIITQLFTVFQVGAALPAVGSTTTLGPRPAKPSSPVTTSDVVHAVDPDQALRYAAASGDTYRIHTDPEFARAEGLPGVILHGMCTLAIAADAVVVCAADGNDRRLDYLFARFTAPVHPGEVLTTSVRSAGGAGAFTATAGPGRQVLDRGQFSVAPA